MVETYPAVRAAFRSAQRALIKRAFRLRSGGYPLVADGIYLQIWKDGSKEGQPKLSKVVNTMIEQGFLEIRWERSLPRAFFTEAGLVELRRLVENPRHLKISDYWHIRRELQLMKAEPGH